MKKAKESKEVLIELRIGASSEDAGQISHEDARRFANRLTHPYREVLEGQRLMFENFKKTAREINAFHSEYAQVLAKYRWYINAGMMLGDVHKVLVAAGENRPQEVDELMIGDYRQGFEAIRARLVSKHRNRSKILREGFRAHKLQMYHSSTLIFLAQSDGLCSGKLMRPKKIQEFLGS